MLKGNHFFTDFQNQMYDQYGYALDKLNPSLKFWNYNKITGQREFRNVFSHHYYLEYAKRFEPIRHKVKKVLEIGVFKGHSMLLWEKYFPNATIYGVDIDLNQKHLGNTPKDICKGKDRIKLKEFNACDSKELSKVIDEGWFDLEEKFDIIIDDGSHHPVHQVQALLLYLPMLKIDGTFVVEDVIDKSNEGNRVVLNRIESIFKMYSNENDFVFEDFLKEQYTGFTNLDGYGVYDWDKIFWTINKIENFKIDIIPAHKYSVMLDDVNLEGKEAEMVDTNKYKLIFMNRL